MYKRAAALGVALALSSASALADVKVGIIISGSGPLASLGIPFKNTFSLLPDTLGGEPVKYILLDDSSDPTNSVKNARKLISEDNVDLIFGTNGLSSTTAIAPIAAENNTPVIALAPASPEVAKNPWVFAVPQPLPIMMSAVVDHMKRNGVKTVGYIGFADSWGDVVLAGIKPGLEKNDIKLVADERYARNDTSAVGQALKVISARPDAVLVGGSGTGGALGHVALAERGYKGQIYHNHAVINRDFLRVGGQHLEGAIVPTGPVMVAEQLPDNNPIKPVALKFVQSYEAAFGANSRNAFAGYGQDAYIMADNAVRQAATNAKPGTIDFRKAVRDALETNKEIVGTHAIYNMTPTDHAGVDERARVLVKIEKGDWKLIP